MRKIFLCVVMYVALNIQIYVSSLFFCLLPKNIYKNGRNISQTHKQNNNHTLYLYMYIWSRSMSNDLIYFVVVFFVISFMLSLWSHTINPLMKIMGYTLCNVIKDITLYNVFSSFSFISARFVNLNYHHFVVLFNNKVCTLFIFKLKTFISSCWYVKLRSKLY